MTIWSFKDQRIVARCQGHQSYVTGVAFDPWRCDERNYRFGSVGEDAKLLLWDFSVGALHKPKAVRSLFFRSYVSCICCSHKESDNQCLFLFFYFCSLKLRL